MKLAENLSRHEMSQAFNIWSERTIYFGVTCIDFWKDHIWPSSHVGLRWAILVLCATCFRFSKIHNQVCCLGNWNNFFFLPCTRFRIISNALFDVIHMGRDKTKAIYVICKQQRRRFALADQRLVYLLHYIIWATSPENMYCHMQTTKAQISLRAQSEQCLCCSLPR